MGNSDTDSTTSESDSSSELDVGSKRFNPLKALYSAKLKVPVPKALLHDNVSTLEGKQLTLGGFTEKFDEARIRQIRASQNKPKLAENEMPQRRFLPEQGPVTRVRSIRHTKNIFIRLEKGFEGPLGQLQRWMEDRNRVRVSIRKQKGVRGHVSGVLELFDKHWNLALSDVCETWTRRKYRYSENRQHPDSMEAPRDCSERLRRLGIVLPELKVRPADGKKNVIITRKVPQLLVKGEMVVLVTLEPGEPQASTSKGTK
ncbi:U7 snRNA-associated Sm-like protein LSm11 [Anopheles merus]|uniref:Sm domain-containing protein n=1 Tax=Anopheles merus TaxID=30066 RepID=A0A182UV29_ANOME|nr:U7 snRNA-associated Sm-like protein LSm11 [Anopheles merus]